MSRYLPGLLFCLLMALTARLASAGLGMLDLVVSSALLVLLLGMLLAAPLSSQASILPGRSLAAGLLLKAGVVLIGLRLDVQALLTLGWAPLLTAMAGLLGALLTALLLGRLAGLGNRLTALLATGTAICGVTAIMVTAPLIRARDHETAHAIACIVLIGMLATLVGPLLLQYLLGDAHKVGMLLGASIPDTAQVTGAALLHQQQFASQDTLAAATLVKLIRNSALLLVVPLVGLMFMRHNQGADSRLPIPWFILGFVALVAVRASGDTLAGEAAIWASLLSHAAWLSEALLLMALAAIGLSLHPRALTALGPRPALVAVLATICAAALALLVLTLQP